MSEHSDHENAEMVVLRTPDEGTREELRERARELGCDLEPYRSSDGRSEVREDGFTPRPEEAVALCRALLEGTRDEVLVADEEGRVTFVSPRLADLADADPAEAAGQPADRILGAIGLPDFEELRGMLTRVSCARTEDTLVDASGTSRPVLLRGVSTPPAGEGGRYVWFVTELTRVRSVERANRILRSELETQSRLLALVSHELRTPLNVILGQLSLLQRGLQGELTEEQRDSIERSARAGNSLLSLINDLIDFARLEAEELELEERSFGIVDLVEEVARTARGLLAESEREVLVHLPDGAAELAVRGDPDRTRQILTQLVTNAVKFSDRGEVGLVVREVEPGDLAGAEGTGPSEISDGRRYLSVSVQDRGEGIPLEERDRVFEPFHQTAQLLSRTRGGSGLGLAIARRLARRQGGELTAGQGEEGGSRFTLLLPRAR